MNEDIKKAVMLSIFIFFFIVVGVLAMDQFGISISNPFSKSEVVWMIMFDFILILSYHNILSYIMSSQT